jgi:hypothetical protein
VTQRGTPAKAPAEGQEAKLAPEIEAHIELIKVAAAEAVASILAERMDAIVENKVKKALSTSIFVATQKMKDAIMKAIQGVLVDSGLLEKFVDRSIDQRMKAGQPVPGSTVKPLAGGSGDTQALKAEIQTMIQKEVASQASSESMKEMIDEKFRAISLYLKSDVIPKAVAQALKAPKPA